MADLKTMLEKNESIEDINKKVNEFIDSAKDFEDKLKLTFVALHLLEKGSELLKSVKPDDFILQVKEKINEMEKDKETLFKVYKTYLKQNDKVYEVLGDKNNRIPKIKEDLQELLNEYDGILNVLVELRDKRSLPERYSKA